MSIPNNTPAIRIEDLSVAYSRSGHNALEGIDLSVPAGQRLAVTGGNGAGKSTLLRVITGLLKPERGHCEVFGQPPQLLRQHHLMVPQQSRLDWSFPMTLERFVASGSAARQRFPRLRPDREERQRLEEALSALNLEPLRGQQLRTLSGGQRQRALLARALVYAPGLWLLDEPENALDSESRSRLEALLDRLQNEGCTLVVATHELDEPGRYDRRIHLESGRVLADCLPASSFSPSASKAHANPPCHHQRRGEPGMLAEGRPFSAPPQFRHA